MVPKADQFVDQVLESLSVNMYGSRPLECEDRRNFGRGIQSWIEISEHEEIDTEYKNRAVPKFHFGLNIGFLLKRRLDYCKCNSQLTEEDLKFKDAKANAAWVLVRVQLSEMMKSSE